MFKIKEFKTTLFLFFIFILIYAWYYIILVLQDGFGIDPVGFFIPEEFFSKKSWQLFKMPLWNPHIDGGFPFFADPQSLFFSLEIILRSLFNNLFGIYISEVFFSFVSIIFFLKYLIRKEIKIETSIIVILALFIFNILDIKSFFFLSILFYYFDKAVYDNKLIDIFKIALIIGFMFFNIHPQWALYILFISSIYYLLLVFFIQKIPFLSLLNKKIIPFLFIPIGLGFLLFSIQLLPIFEFSLLSNRGVGLTIADALNDSVLPWYFISIFIPKILSFGYTPYVQNTLYTGIILIIFILNYFFYNKEKHIYEKVIIFLLFLVLILSCGKFLPGYEFLFKNIPFMSFFRGSSRILFLYRFLLIILFAFSLNWFFKSLNNKLLKKISISFLFFGVCSFVLWLICLLGENNIFFFVKKIINSYYVNQPEHLYNYDVYFDKAKFLFLNAKNTFFQYSIIVLICSFVFNFIKIFKNVNIKKNIIIILILPLILLDLWFNTDLDIELLFKNKSSQSSKEFFFYEEKNNNPNYIKWLDKNDANIYRTITIGSPYPVNSAVFYDNKYETQGYFSIVLNTYFKLWQYICKKIEKKNLIETDFSFICKEIFGFLLDNNWKYYNKNLLALLNIKYVLSRYPLQDKNLILKEISFEPLDKTYIIPPFLSQNKKDEYLEYINKKHGVYLPNVYTYTDKIYIYQNLYNLPHVKMFYKYKIEKNIDKIFTDLSKDDFELDKIIYLNCEPKINNEINIIGEGYAKIITYLPELIEIKASTNKKAILFLSEMFYPGWNAYLNNKAIPVYKANGTFRAVIIPSGEHKIIFKFENKIYLIGKWISIITFLSILIFIVIFKFIKRRKEKKLN